MINKEYAMAYREVIEILKYIPNEDVAKIPQEEIELYKEYMDKDYKYEIDETKEFEEQEISKITKAILANIFRDYWATQYQKERILAKEKYDLEKIEKEKIKKYNPDNLFKNKENTIKYNLPIEIKKKTFFEKLIRFLKNILRHN